MEQIIWRIQFAIVSALYKIAHLLHEEDNQKKLLKISVGVPFSQTPCILKPTFRVELKAAN